MDEDTRQRFDALVEEAIGNLPESLRTLIDEVPVIVLDKPTPEILRDLGIDPSDEAQARELCGLHSGSPFTEPGLEVHHGRAGAAPAGEMSTIHLFRIGILHLALDPPGHEPLPELPAWPRTDDADDAVYSEIEVTLLHEIGHQFGLDEDDLERLGYD